MASSSTIGVHESRAGRFDLLFLVAVTIAFFAPHLRPTAFPVLDSASLFEQFHFFYSSFYLGDGIPQWYPFGFYGLQSDMLRLWYFTPAFYLVALVGRVAGVEDALLLFKVGLLVEHLTLLVGMYLLSGVLFAQRTTRLFLCISIVGGTVWYAAPFFNFRIYTLVPLLLYCLVRMLQTGRVRYLLGAGLTGFSWLLGNPPYFGPLFVFVLVVVNLALIRGWVAVLPALRTRALAVGASLVLMAALGASYAYAVYESTANITTIAPGRTEKGDVDLETFLTYGGRLDRRELPRVVALGSPTHLANGSGRDVAVYSGLPVVVFLLFALVLVRDPVLAASFAAACILALLSLGGAVAHAIYYFPTMSYYRHIAHVYGLVKLFLLICAGYGIDRFFRESGQRQLVAVAAAIGLFGVAALALDDPAVGLRVSGYAAALVCCLAASRAWAGTRRWLTVGIQTGLVVGLLLDLGLFQRAVFAEVPPTVAVDQQALLASTRVRGIEWQSARTTEPPTPASRLAWSLATRLEALVVYTFAYNFASFDVCTSAYRTDLVANGMARLLARLTPGTPESNVVLGCGTSKLRVLRQPAGGSGDEDRFPGGLESDPDSHPVVTRFTANMVVAEVSVAGTMDAWLVYADAYHPGWTANVNGAPAKVHVAFEGQKGVKLGPGRNVVQFTFRRPVADFLAGLLAVYGVLFSLAVLFVLARGMVRGV